MDETKLYSENIDELKNEIQQAKNFADTTKLELLKHYLINYILFINLSDEEAKDSPIFEKLTEISILLGKVNQMTSKIDKIESNREVNRVMMRNKTRKNKGASTTPALKFKKKSEDLKRKIEIKEDKNINVKKSKSTNLS